MNREALPDWQHPHDFSITNPQGERRTRYVLVLTAITMVAEIIAGSIFGSMALLADGWHMATHVAAFLITAFAYAYARKHAEDPSYAFGTGKVNVLGGFASAIALAVVALVMAVESLQRFTEPQQIHFNEAITVAIVGLIVNLVSAFMLRGNHSHGGHAAAHHHHHDHNLRAAYLHVLADAVTSVLAIVALSCGKYLGWSWLDPLMGIVGAVIITRWSYGLIRQTSPILLDASIDAGYLDQIKEAIEQDRKTWVADLHVWKLGPNHYAAIIALVALDPRPADYYKHRLADFSELTHLTIEVSPGRIAHDPDASSDRD